MDRDPGQERAKAIGLRYVDAAALPWSRRRCGRGFALVDSRGRAVGADAHRRRVQSLAIPPAWTSVRLASDPLSHIQAVGRDGEGRLQYRYHELWTESGAERKHKRLLTLGAGLGDLRRTIAAGLRKTSVDRDLALACALALLDRAALRVGYPEYCRDTGGRGAMTLRTRDVRAVDGGVALAFHGKGGKRIERRVEDPALRRALMRLKEAGGPTLFSWREGGGAASLDAHDVNAFLHAELGDEVSARDFRTFRASALAAEALAGAEGLDLADRRRALRAAIADASEFLANTQAVCRASYVHPLVQAAFLDEEADLQRLFRGPVRAKLTRGETALLRLLEG